MSPDGGGPAGLLRHSVLCSEKVSPGSGLWPQPDLELLHLCKSKFKHPDFASQTTLLKPCTSAALLQLASASPHHHLSAVSLPTSPSSPSLQLDPQGPPLPPLSLISTFYSLLPLSSCHIHLAKPQPWINPPSLFFFFHSYSRAAEQYRRKSHKQKAWLYFHGLQPQFGKQKDHRLWTQTDLVWNPVSILAV